MLKNYEGSGVEVFYKEAVKQGQKAPVEEIWNACCEENKGHNITLGEWRRFALKYGNNSPTKAS